MQITSRKRETWADFVKGAAILLVVLGHSGNPVLHHYIFWFHMPIFFMISGYFFKPIKHTNELKPYILKKAKHFLIPYFFFGIIISFVFYILNLVNGTASLFYFVKQIAMVLYGGRAANGTLGVFWFITCLFVTQILFTVLLLKFKSKYKIATALLIFYLLAHLEAILAGKIDLRLPWNFDVSFMAIVYYAFGYYIKQAQLLSKKKFNQMVIPFSFILTGLLVVAENLGMIKYEFDMKYHAYNHILLDFFVPIAISYVFIYFSYLLYKRINESPFILRGIESLGLSSLTVMYLHIPMNDGIRLFTSYDWVLFTLIGVMVPYLLHQFILRSYPFTRSLFLGENVPKAKLKKG